MTIGLRTLLAAAGTSLVLLLAGCGSGAPIIEFSAEPPSDTVQWMNGFCGAVKGFAADNNAMQIPTTVDDDGQQVISAMLGDYVTILDKAIGRMADLPPITDPVGEKVKQAFVGNFTSARDLATDAKTQLDAASPADFAAQSHAASAMTAVQEAVLKAISSGDEIESSPELTAASASAENCG
jgi:hypothetical protein